MTGILFFCLGALWKIPEILDDKIIGSSARDLWNDAQKMLLKIQKDKLTVPKAIIGFWPVNSKNDDLELYTNEKKIIFKRNFFS